MANNKPYSAGDEAVVRLHELIRNLYMAATLGDPDHADDRALELLCHAVPLDAALIVRLDPQGVELDDYRMRGLSGSFIHAYRRTRSDNPVLANALAIPAGHTKQLATTAAGGDCAPSSFHHRVLPYHGIGQQMNFGYRDVATSALYVLQAYRFRGAPSFTKNQAWITRFCLPHLATSHGQALILRHALANDPVVYYPTALCDARGTFFFVQEECVALLREQYPDWDGNQIPFELPSSSGISEFMIGDLAVHVTPQGDLSIVRIWRRPATDFLSRREREIAELVAQQLPTKAIAQQLNLAPSTVGNHLQSIFRKLGITSRSDLVTLMD